MPFEKPEPRKTKKLTEAQKEELKSIPLKDRAKKRIEWGAYDDGIYVDSIMDKEDF